MNTLELELNFVATEELAWRYIVSGISTMPETEGQLLYIAKGSSWLIKFTTEFDGAKCQSISTARIKSSLCRRYLRDIALIPVPSDEDLFLEMALPPKPKKRRAYQQLQWRIAELRAELCEAEDLMCEEVRRNYEGQVEGLLYALGLDHVQAMRQVYA